MANQPVKKKYTIWQNLLDGGHFRVFKCPDYPGIWGTEKKLTYKHNQVTIFHVDLTDEKGFLTSNSFNSMIDAMSYWLEHSGKK